MGFCSDRSPQVSSPFEGQNHQAHIDTHRAFMSSSLVKSNLQVLALLQGHISEHVALMAREEIMAEAGPQLQQMQMMRQGLGLRTEG